MIDRSPIRLAMRDEGPTVAVYLASIDSMEGAEELLRIRRDVMDELPDSAQLVLGLLRDYLEIVARKRLRIACLRDLEDFRAAEQLGALRQCDD